ncbi:hypothetical protein J6590_057466 [Homalodisca vitripennis]|nr:hypothetical protein J6590_057466 [Homalodisca vitripennis]
MRRLNTCHATLGMKAQSTVDPWTSSLFLILALLVNSGPGGSPTEDSRAVYPDCNLSIIISYCEGIYLSNWLEPGEHTPVSANEVQRSWRERRLERCSGLYSGATHSPPVSRGVRIASPSLSVSVQCCVIIVTSSHHKGVVEICAVSLDDLKVV